MLTIARRNSAFTLIELLIVVAIIAILAAIAVPNFLEAQTRAKVSRVKSDIRSLVTATETYMVDHSRYPLPSDEDGHYMPNPAAAGDEWFETKTAISLTTPISYMSSRVGDTFAPKGSSGAQNFHYTSLTYLDVAGHPRDEFYEYFDDIKGEGFGSRLQYYYLSYGPDSDHDFEGEHEGEHEHGEEGGAIYDATNGTVSSGDLYYAGPGVGFL